MSDSASAAVMLLGMVFMAIGTAAYDWRLGFITAGILLLLSIRSLWRWIK